MKSGANLRRKFVPAHSTSFQGRNFDLTQGNMNTSGYAKKTYGKLKSSQYSSHMKQTRSTKHLLRSQKHSASHAQNDEGGVTSHEGLRAAGAEPAAQNVGLEEADVGVQLAGRGADAVQLEHQQQVPHEELPDAQGQRVLVGAGRAGDAEPAVHQVAAGPAQLFEGAGGEEPLGAQAAQEQQHALPEPRQVPRPQVAHEVQK